MKTSTTHITIDLDAVLAAGGVTAAIAQWCAESDTTSCGIVGPTFATSGPGPGWSKQFGPSDYASRAFAEGASFYVDEDDGRMIAAEYTAEPDEDESEDTTILRDICGCAYTEGEWTDESVVRIECPEIQDATDAPEAVAKMAQAVIDYHYPESDCAAWKKLLESIRMASELLADIDIDALAK